MKTTRKSFNLFSLFAAILFISIIPTVVAQTGVRIAGTAGTADPSSMLDVTSNSKGILIPRMLQSERTGISSPATGLLVYQTDGSKGFYYFDGAIWVQLAAGALSGSGANDFLARWSGGGLTTGVTQDNGTNVGIGTAPTANKLDVNGIIHTSTDLLVGTKGSGFMGSNQGGSIELGPNDGTASTPFIDFHFGTGTAQDNNVRLINDANNVLDLTGASTANLKIQGLSGAGTIPVTVDNTGILTKGNVAAGSMYCPTCPVGYIQIDKTYYRLCMKQVTSTKTWYAASDAAHADGGKLASFEQLRVWNLAGNSIVNDSWLNDKCGDDNHVYTNAGVAAGVTTTTNYDGCRNTAGTNTSLSYYVAFEYPK